MTGSIAAIITLGFIGSVNLTVTVGYGIGAAVAAVVAGSPLDYTAPREELDFTAPDNRLDFTVPR